MFKLGDKSILKLYLGDKPITRVYLGSKLVYNSSPTFLEYIEFDGNSRIDTGIIPSNNMEFETGVMFSVVQSTNLSIIASRDGEKRYQPIGTIQNKWSASIGGMYDENGSPVAANIKYDLRSVVSNGDSVSLYSGNTLVSSATSSGGIPTKSLYLFARNYNPIDSYVTGRLYYCKIWDNGVLIQDLRPALDPSGKVCMYDTVSGKYLYNAGTGELKAGGRFVESIVFDGKSYIDTGYLPNEQTYVEYTFEVYNASEGTANYQGLFGSRKDQTEEGYVFNVFVHNATSLRIDWGVYLGGYTGYSLNTKYTMKAGLGEVYLDDTLVKTYTVPATGTSPYSIYLGNFNNAGKPYTSGALQKVYGFKVYENNALIQDLRPYVDSNGEVCFKDVVTDTLFYNQGTGTLTYTKHE